MGVTTITNRSTRHNIDGDTKLMIPGTIDSSREEEYPTFDEEASDPYRAAPYRHLPVKAKPEPDLTPAEKYFLADTFTSNLLGYSILIRRSLLPVVKVILATAAITLVCCGAGVINNLFLHLFPISDENRIPLIMVLSEGVLTFWACSTLSTARSRLYCGAQRKVHEFKTRDNC